MRRFLSGLILLFCLAFCPDLAAGQWNRGSQPSVEEKEELDEAEKEEMALYFVGILATLVAAVVTVQFCREAKESIPAVHTYADEKDLDF